MAAAQGNIQLFGSLGYYYPDLEPLVSWPFHFQINGTNLALKRALTSIKNNKP